MKYTRNGILFILLLASCVTGQDAVPVPPARNGETNTSGQGNFTGAENRSENSFTVMVINNTFFDIELNGESNTVSSLGRKEITLPVYRNEITEGYDIRYRLPLAPGVSRRIRGENIIIKTDQRELVIDRAVFSETGSFFILNNDSSQVVRLRRGNTGNYRNSLGPDGFSPGTSLELSPGKTNVYSVDSGSTALVVEAGQKNFAVSVNTVSSGFVYSFTFDGAALTLTDARPLYRIGEPAWSLVIPDAEGPLRLVPAAGEITGLFVPSPKGILQYAFDSKGKTEKNAVPAGENFDIGAAARTGGGVLLAGYSYDERTGGYTPVVQKQRENGAAVVLVPSALRDRRSAWFSVIAEKTAAEKTIAGNGDPVWLAAGGADSGVNAPEGYKAYVRAFAGGGTSLNPLWETGPEEFDARAGNKGPKCGAVRAAVHDPARDRWLLTGGLIEQDRLGNPVKDSYIAELNAAGEIVTLDFSFPGLSFNKILLGQSGRAADGEAARYLAGEEQRAGETRAVLVKYKPPGREMWRFANHPGHSFYQDAVLDEENGQIVLAGTLGAGDETGTGGRPFIEGVDLETGTLLWREELSALKGAVLVTGIVKAPDYGFVLSLSGIRDGFYGPPYMAARVNARGRLLNHTVR